MESAKLNSGLEVLDPGECLRLLATQTVGRLGIIVEGRPEIHPVNFAVAGEYVIIRSDQGTKLVAALSGPVVFEVDQFEAVSHTGWSVMIHGSAQLASPRAGRNRFAEPGPPPLAGSRPPARAVDRSPQSHRSSPQHPYAPPVAARRHGRAGYPRRDLTRFYLLPPIVQAASRPPMSGPGFSGRLPRVRRRWWMRSTSSKLSNSSVRWVDMIRVRPAVETYEVGHHGGGGGGVEVGGRLIEDQDLGIGEQCPGQKKPLALSARDLTSVGAGLSGPTGRQGSDPIRQSHAARLARRGRSSVGLGRHHAEVVAEGGSEDVIALQGAGDQRRELVGMQISNGNRPGRSTAQGDRTGLRGQQAQHGREEAALSAAAGSHHGQASPLPELNVGVDQHGIGPAGRAQGHPGGRQHRHGDGSRDCREGGGTGIGVFQHGVRHGAHRRGSVQELRMRRVAR